MRQRRVRALVALAVVALSGSAVWAQPGKPPKPPPVTPQAPELLFKLPGAALRVGDLAELLPADTMAYGSWSGQEAIHAAYLKTDFRRFWGEPSLVGLRGELVAGVEEQLAKMKQAAGEDEGDAAGLEMYVGLWELMKLGFRRPGAFGLVQAPGVPKEVLGETGPMPLAVLLLDVGENPQDQQVFAEKIYKPMMGMLLKMSGEEGKLSASQYRGVKLNHFVPTPDVAGLKLTWGLFRNVFLFTFNEQVAKVVLDAATGRSPTLAASKPYVTLRAKWGPGAALTRSYVSFAQIIRFVNVVEPDDLEVHRVLTAMGLDRAHYGGSIRYAGRAVVANRYITAPSKEGVLLPFVNRPLTEADLSLVPADALAGVVVRATPSQLYAYAKEQIRQAERAEQPRIGAEDALDAAKDLAVTVALSIFGDTGGFVVYENKNRPLVQLLEMANPMMWMMGGGRPPRPGKPPGTVPPFDDEAEYGEPLHVVFKWKVVDVAKAKAMGPTPAAVIGRKLFGCFAAELARLPEPRKYQWKDRLIRFMRDDRGGQVVWVYQGDYLLVGNTIRGVLNVLSSKPADAAVKAESVRRYAAHRPKDVTLFGYVNMPSVVRAAMSVAKTAIERGKAIEGFPFKTAPNVEQLAAAVTPVVFTASADDAGVLFTEIGSMSLTGWAVAAAPAATFVVPMIMMGGLGQGAAVVKEPDPPLPKPDPNEDF